MAVGSVGPALRPLAAEPQPGWGPPPCAGPATTRRQTSTTMPPKNSRTPIQPQSASCFLGLLQGERRNPESLRHPARDTSPVTGWSPKGNTAKSRRDCRFPPHCCRVLLSRPRGCGRWPSSPGYPSARPRRRTRRQCSRRGRSDICESSSAGCPSAAPRPPSGRRDGRWIR